MMDGFYHDIARADATLGRGTLGVNRAEYAVPLNNDQEAAEQAWCVRKNLAIDAVLASYRPLRRLGDIGCRTGADALRWKYAAAADEVHGFEIAEQPLVLAGDRGVVPHLWVSGESPCPVEDGFFDAVVAGDVIEHLFDTDVFLEELNRVLRPDGVLIVTTPNLSWWWSRLRMLAGRMPAGSGAASFRHASDTAVDRKHLRVVTPAEWVYLFKQHGFTVERVSGFNYPRLLRFPFWRLDDWLTRCPSLAHSVLFVLRKHREASTQ